MKEQRKLTKAEERRKMAFEALKEELGKKGYEEHPLTIGIVYANVMAMLLGFPFGLLFLFAYYRIWGFQAEASGDLTGLLFWLAVLIVGFILLAVVHELIHGFFWSLFTKGHWKSIEFGFIAAYLTPYCTCKEPLKKSQYVIGSLMPTALLGLLPALAALAVGSLPLLFVGILMIFSGGGDLTIILKLICYRSGGTDTIYVDHPYECGLVAFTK